MTIEEILRKYDEDDYDKIILDYDGYIEEFDSMWELDEDVWEDEAKAKIEKGNLIIIVR